MVGVSFITLIKRKENNIYQLDGGLRTYRDNGFVCLGIRNGISSRKNRRKWNQRSSGRIIHEQAISAFETKEKKSIYA